MNRALALAIACVLALPAHATIPQKIDPTQQVLKDHVIPAVRLPPTLTHGADTTEEMLEVYARLTLVFTGLHGYSALRPDAGFMWFQFRDRRTGQLVNLFPGDTFWLRYADGSTVQVKFIGPFAPSGLFFQIVDGSEKRAPTALQLGSGAHYVYLGRPTDARLGNGGTCADGNLDACPKERGL